jgi:uncharacterized protein (DUF362 family)/ferredoxin
MYKVMIQNAEYEDCLAAVAQAFELFPMQLEGKKVMVKPNVLRGNAPEEAITTHPAVLKAVIDVLEKSNPAEITVGDNPGAMSYGANEETFRKTGLLDAAGKYYRNIGQNVSEVKVPSGFFKTLRVSKAILEADIYISVPKFKTHGLTVLSGAIKNNYGILPGAQKANGHCIAGNPFNFNELVVDIFGIRIPDLVIIDGILGMEGNGPASTDLRHIGKILASNNAVALDATISRMMGFDPADLRFLQIAKERGYGSYEEDKIEIIGELSPVPDFLLPPSARGEGGGLPPGAGGFMERLTKLRPKADESLCTGCGSCVEECPAEALTIEEVYPEVDPEKCIACFCCQEKCPEKAIQLQ